MGREAVGLWQGHGVAANDYGVGVKRSQMERFGNLYGCQHWNPAMICWGLGGFGVGLTGALETTTKEDVAENSAMVVFWGANSPSQASTVTESVPQASAAQAESYPSRSASCASAIGSRGLVPGGAYPM